jgi:hypothetical protein
MPETSMDLALTETDLDVLERIREQEGLPGLAQTAEWLAKRRLRHAVQQATRRRQTLYLVERKQRCES